MNDLRKEFNSKIRNAYLRDNNIICCEKCKKDKSITSLNVHHIIALADGGTNDYGNLIALCTRCHDEWHSIEGIDEVTFDEWLNIPPYYALIYTFKILDKQGHDDEITYRQVKDFLRMGSDLYKIVNKHKDE